MSSLFACFSRVIAEGLRFEEQLEQLEQPPPAEAIHAAFLQELEQARQAARQSQKREADIDLAAFAVAAWMDEVGARSAQFSRAAQPLQARLFATHNAGNEFFSKLEQLTPEQDEVREVYYVLLCLGFRGQYWHPDHEGELNRLKQLHGRQLPLRPAALHTLGEERLTPQPYEMPDPPGPRIPRHWDQWALRGVLACSVLVPLVLLLYFALAARPNADTSAAQAVAQLIAGVDCAELRAEVGAGGIATVTGWVKKGEDAEQLKAALAAVKGIREVRAELQIRIWPYCEVVALLKPLVQRNGQSGMGLKITPVAGHQERFVAGEQVIVQVRPPGFGAFIAVDYYVIDGNVVHMAPNAREPGSQRQLPPNEVYRLGDKLQPPWVIQPPFGQEMITVIAAPTPLSPTLPPETEDAKRYLERLRGFVQANKDNPRVVADYMFLQTEAGPGGDSPAAAAPPAPAPAAALPPASNGLSRRGTSP